ncbi:hypothetical protein DSECCO2_26850 [anaerobic digester metagenome]
MMRLKEILRNNRGSSLPFVLIVSLIIAMLIGILSMVAVSGVQYTQRTVEDRQAYLDAKSVIEFARIEITEEFDKIKADYEFNRDKAGYVRPEGGVLFYVYGSPRTASSDTLQLRRVNVGESVNPGEERLGSAELIEDFSDSDATAGNPLDYHFEVTTENLGRQLNYKTGFSYTYKETAGTGTPPGGVIPPSEAELEAPNALGWIYGNVIFTWYSKEIGGSDLYFSSTSPTSVIHGTKASGNWVLNVPKTGSNLKLSYSDVWSENNKVSFQAENIETTNLPTMTKAQYEYDAVKTMYVNGDLNVSVGSKVTINAERLVVKGNVNVASGGTLIVNSDYTWVKGAIVASSSGAVLEFNGIKYLESQKVDIKNGTNFTVNGSSSGGSQFIVKGDVYHNGAGLFRLNNLYWFECANLTFNTKGIIDIHAQVVKIANNFTLDSDVNRNSVIDVQYLYAGGMTKLTGGDILVVFTCQSFPDKGNFIFAGGYYQKNAEVRFNNAENIIMQGVITFETNCRLDFNADKIYLDSDVITHGDWGNSTVSFGGINSGTGTDFYIKGLISWTDSKAVGSGGYLYQIGNGIYKIVAGESLKTLDEKTKLPYQGPGKITIPGTGGSSSTETGEIKSVNDAGVYY